MPYRCNDCGERFTTIALVQAHTMRNHGTIGNVRYEDTAQNGLGPGDPVRRQVRPSCHTMTIEPIVTVQEMKTSAGSDYFVHIRVQDREMTPRMYKERWKAEYEVDEWKWLFRQGEKPDLMAYGPD